MRTCSHDRLVDRQPASFAHGNTGKVIAPDVPRCIQVSVQRKLTSLALKLALRFSVCARNMTTLTALLACVTWINVCHANPLGSSFVPHKYFEPCKAPSMVSSSLFFADSCTCPKVSQVFKNNGCTGLYGSNYALREHMITILAETVSPSTNFSELSFGRLRAFRLELTAQPKYTVFNFSPVTFTEKDVVACYCGAINPKINTNGFSTGYKLRIAGLNYNVKEQLPLLPGAEISRSNVPMEILFIVGGDLECNMLSSFDACQRSFGSVEFDAGGSSIVTNGAQCRLRAGHFAFFLCKSFGRFKGFCSFHTGGTNELRRKIRDISFIFVREIVKFNSIDTRLFPTDRTSTIESISELSESSIKDALLLLRTVYLDLDRALCHIHILTHVSVIVKYLTKKGSCFLPRLKPWVSCTKEDNDTEFSVRKAGFALKIWRWYLTMPKPAQKWAKTTAWAKLKFIEPSMTKDNWKEWRDIYNKMTQDELRVYAVEYRLGKHTSRARETRLERARNIISADSSAKDIGDLMVRFRNAGVSCEDTAEEFCVTQKDVKASLRYMSFFIQTDMFEIIKSSAMDNGLTVNEEIAWMLFSHIKDNIPKLKIA